MSERREHRVRARVASGMRLRWAFGVIAVACGAPAAPVAPRFEIAAPASIDCVHSSRKVCVAALPFAVDNTGAAPATLRSVRATREGLDGAIVWTFDPKPLRIGRTRVVPPTGVGAGNWSIEIVATDASGGELRRTIAVVVHDRLRETALAVCDACHGTWGTYGLLELEGCDCPTTDPGKTCHDVADCQGDCLEPEVEPIDATTYRFVGRCSPRTSTFGCLGRVRRGVHRRVGSVRIPSICVD
jgi:hypothetical protein